MQLHEIPLVEVLEHRPYHVHATEQLRLAYPFVLASSARTKGFINLTLLLHFGGSLQLLAVQRSNATSQMANVLKVAYIESNQSDGVQIEQLVSIDVVLPKGLLGGETL